MAPTQYTKYTVETLYIGESIDLKKVQEGIKEYSYVNREHPLVIRLLKDQYVALTKFGAVTFWNVPWRLRSKFLRELKPFVRARRDSYPYDEETKVAVGGDSSKVTFDKVVLPKLGSDEIKIISYVLSQSVALERHEDEIDTILAELDGIVADLKHKGRIRLRQKEVMKQIGRVLSVKQTAVSHLSLFDKPEEVWDLPEIENLYNRMTSEYELQGRFDSLNEKVDYISEVAELLMGVLADKKSNFLESVIIALFIVDILIWFFPPPPVAEFFAWLKGLFAPITY